MRLESAQNSSTIPTNLDFEESYLYSTSPPLRCRTCLIYTIFDIFWQWCKNNVDSKYVSLKTVPGNLTMPWLDTSVERHLRYGHLRHISINFLCDLYGKNDFR